MSCKICGRSSCTRIFHPIQEQELYDKYQGMDDQALMIAVVSKDMEITDLSSKIKELEKQIEDLKDNINWETN
jgi:hypothetical protein